MLFYFFYSEQLLNMGKVSAVQLNPKYAQALGNVLQLCNDVEMNRSRSTRNDDNHLLPNYNSIGMYDRVMLE